MNYGKTLNQVARDVAEIKGSIGVLANDHKHTAEEVKKVEGRQWGLVVAVLFCFMTSILALTLGRPLSPKLLNAIHSVSQFFTF